MEPLVQQNLISNFILRNVPFLLELTEMSSPEAAKKRILPAWMTKKTAEPAEKAKIKSKRRKRTDLARYAAYLLLKNQRRMGCSQLPFLPSKSQIGRRVVEGCGMFV